MPPPQTTRKMDKIYKAMDQLWFLREGKISLVNPMKAPAVSKDSCLAAVQEESRQTQHSHRVEIRVEGRQGCEQAEHRGLLEEWKYSVWCYNDAYMSQNTQHPEWTVM